MGVRDEERWCTFYKCNLRLPTRESTNSLLISTWLALCYFMVLLIKNKEPNCASMECLFKPMSVKYWRSKDCWPQGQLCWSNSCSRFPWGRPIILRFLEKPTVSYALSFLHSVVVKVFKKPLFNAVSTWICSFGSVHNKFQI